MRPGRWIPAILVVLGLIVLPNCSERGSTSQTNGERRAYEVVAAFLRQYPSGHVVRERRHADGRLAYIEVALRDTGKLTTRLAALPNGEIIGLSDAIRQFDKDHQAVWGHLDLESARAVKHRAQSARLVATGTYASSQAAIEVIRARLEQLDARAWIGEAPPVFAVAVTVPELLSLSKEPWVTTVAIDRGDSMQKASVASPPSDTGVEWPTLADSAQVPSTSLTTDSDTYANAVGLDGAGVKVGIFESYANSTKMAGCRIWTAHEAFAQASVSYQRSSGIACSTDAQCQPSGNTPNCAAGAVCKNSLCIDSHATEVMSRIAAAQGSDGNAPAGDYHAAKVDFFVEQNRHTGAYTNADIDSAFDYFSGAGAQLVNISTGGTPFHSALAVYMDYHSRHNGLIPVMGAGNRASLQEDSAPGSTVTCQGFNTICVGGSSPLRSDPRDRNEVYTSAVSRWRNISDNGWEFEKPDVGAEATEAHVASMSAINKWNVSGGTSFAAPTVAGLIALHMDMCREETANRNSAFYRAFLRTVSAFDPSRVELYTASGTHSDSCPTGVSTPLSRAKLGVRPSPWGWSGFRKVHV